MLVLFFADKQTCAPFIVPVCDFSVEFSDLYGILGLFAVQVFISTARKIGVWLSLVERYVRDVEAASSNLVTPTLIKRTFPENGMSVFCFCLTDLSNKYGYEMQI